MSVGLAEGQGFEPWVPGYRTMVFKTISLGHSDSPPAGRAVTRPDVEGNRPSCRRYRQADWPDQDVAGLSGAAEVQVPRPHAAKDAGDVGDDRDVVTQRDHELPGVAATDVEVIPHEDRS